MYYEYFFLLYLIPLLGFICYTIMVIGRKKILGKIYVFRHTLTKYVVEEEKRRVERKWLLNVIGSVILVSLILLAMTMPYTLTKQYIVAKQKVETMLSLRRKMPVVIALDISGSMYGEKLYYARKTVKLYIDTVIGKVLIGFIAFNDYVRIAIPPTTDKELILEKLMEIKAAGGTIYSEPLATAYRWLTPYSEFNITSTIIFVTDGLPFADDIPVYREIVYKCALKNITIYPIFIETPGEGKYKLESARIRLEEMAEITGGKLYTVEDVKNLISIFEKLAEETIRKAGNYTISTQIKYPIDVKSYLVHQYIALAFVAFVLFGLVRLGIYRITF